MYMIQTRMAARATSHENTQLRYTSLPLLRCATAHLKSANVRLGLFHLGQSFAVDVDRCRPRLSRETGQRLSHLHKPLSTATISWRCWA